MFKRLAERREHGDDGDHGRDHERVRTEYDETQNRHADSDAGGGVIFFLQPLLQEDYNEHSGHDEADSLRVESQQRTDESADGSAGKPVEMVEECDKEHEPAFVDVLRYPGGIIYGKGFIAHPENEVIFLPA